MPILIPAKSLTGPQGGATGILAGLLQGLAQGMPIGEQLKNQKRRTDLADQEMQLRRGQIGRSNRLEDEDRDRQKRLGKILADIGSMPDEGVPGTMGPGGPAPQNGSETQAEGMGAGPPSSGGYGPLSGDAQAQPQGPGVGGPPLQAQAAPHEQRIAAVNQMMRSGDYTPEEVHMVHEAIRRDEHLRAIKTNAQRIGSAIGENMKPRGERGENAYTAYDKFGNPDDSAQIAAQHFQEQIANLDTSDPDHAAAVLDKIDEADKEVRKDASAKRSFAQARQQMDMGFQQDMANAQAQGPGSKANSETTELYNDWHSNNVTDDEMQKKWPLARQGMLHATEDMEKMKMETMRLQQENDLLKQYWDTPEGRQKMSDITQGREIAVEGAKKKTPRIFSPAQITKANEDIEKAVQAKFPDLEGGMFSKPSQEDIDKNEVNRNNLRAQLQQQAGVPSVGRSSAPKVGANEAQGGQKAPAGKDTAQSLWSAFKGGQISKEELKKRAAAAGLSPDEFKALAGAK